MEIVNASAGYLCNFEVMEQLKKIKDSKKKQKVQLATITYETLRYLENTPCSQQTPDGITAAVKELKKFNLSKNEILTLINLCPTTPLEIQVMIEESEERLTEEQVELILQIIAQRFPHTVKEKVENEEEQT